MTKERLEELIKQGATIYCLMNNSKYIADFDLSTGNFNVASDCSIIVENEITGHCYGYGFEQLYETREQAEWHLKTYAERIERFEPPMWEEIKDKYSFGFMNCKNSVVCFSVFKKYNSLNHIVVYSCDYDDYIYRDISTKENYEKACEVVRDLFKGEK